MTEETLQGVNRKELRAWEKLYGAYYAPLCSYADNLVRDRDAAQDIVQDTLIKVWESDRIFPSVREFTWYIYRAVYNNALYYLRARENRRKALEEMEFEEAEMPEQQFAKTVQEEIIRQLYEYIEELPEERKKVMLLSLKGHTGEEIARILGITIHTVKTQKNRSIKYLREKMKGSVLFFLL